MERRKKIVTKKRYIYGGKPTYIFPPPQEYPKEIVVISNSKKVLNMKLLIDTRGKRVLFAEAGKECVDFLFHILSLPVATVVRLLREEGMVGSLPNLYQSLENLNAAYIQPGRDKKTYLKPAVPVAGGSSVPLLALDGAQTQKKSYRCPSICPQYHSDDPRAICPSCGGQLNIAMTYVAPPATAEDGGGLVEGVVTYMVMDDLVVKPMSTTSTIALLNSFNVKEVGALEEKVVNLGMKEAIKLLKTSLQSTKVLTDVYF